MTASGTRFGAPRGDASEQVAFEIRRYLSARDLRPGERLGTEQELAAEFGVSRPTLREGLRLLASSHLIRATQGPGRRDLRREHAERGHAPQRQRVDRGDARDRRASR